MLMSNINESANKGLLSDGFSVASLLQNRRKAQRHVA